MAMAWSFSEDNAIPVHYVLPVLWIMSCFLMMG